MGQMQTGDAAGSAAAWSDPATPIDGFARCHQGILQGVQSFGELPALMASAVRARTIAAGVLATFEHAVLAHHGDEEGELFPAVLRWAAKGEERERVELMVRKLTAEHRSVESAWREMRPAVEAATRGKAAELDEAAVASLVAAYNAHAAFEEEQFLPLAQEILGRNSAHLASLGMSLHMRHAPRIPGYI